MINRWSSEQQKERVRQRVRAQIDPNSYEYYPETVSTDHYNNDIYQRVAVYARVSTDDVRQTTSFELQKKYYEEFVSKHPKWELLHIYAEMKTPSLIQFNDLRRLAGRGGKLRGQGG